MTYDTHFRHAQALDPSGLDTIATCLHAIQAAAKDCRNAGVPFESDPAVVLLARHLGSVASLNTLLNSIAMAGFRERVEALGYRIADRSKHGNFEAEGIGRNMVIAFKPAPPADPRQGRRDAVAHACQAKTGALLDIACHQRLKAHLTEIFERSVSRKGPICRSSRGNQYNANNLGSAIYRAVRAVPDMPRNRSLHGLRYAAGSTMEEAGCGVAEIEAVLGHRTFRMALKYASQRLRAKAAIAKVEAAE